MYFNEHKMKFLALTFQHFDSHSHMTERCHCRIGQRSLKRIWTVHMSFVHSPEESLPDLLVQDYARRKHLPFVHVGQLNGIHLRKNWEAFLCDGTGEIVIHHDFGCLERKKNL